MTDTFQIILSLSMGIALAASCGFRVFIPLLAVALTARFADMRLSTELAWVTSDIALYCLTAAAVVEIISYYVPVVDNALDALQTPLVLIAGALLTSGMMPELPEYIRWGLGIVAGAGTAGAVHAGTATVRGASTATGVAPAVGGNALIATVENICSVIGSLLAIVVPVLAVLGLIIMGCAALFIIRRIRRRRTARAAHA